MIDSKALQTSFGNGASPFMRWFLSPFLLIFGAVFCIPTMDALNEGLGVGVILGCALIILCFSGILALWGVPYVSRLISGIVAAGFSAYLISECFIDFNGSLGLGEGSSSANPINSILGFITFGLPCIIFTIFGRFTFWTEPEPNHIEDDFDVDEEDPMM